MLNLLRLKLSSTRPWMNSAFLTVGTSVSMMLGMKRYVNSDWFAGLIVCNSVMLRLMLENKCELSFTFSDSLTFILLFYVNCSFLLDKNSFLKVDEIISFSIFSCPWRVSWPYRFNFNWRLDSMLLMKGSIELKCVMYGFISIPKTLSFDTTMFTLTYPRYSLLWRVFFSLERIDAILGVTDCS